MLYQIKVYDLCILNIQIRVVGTKDMVYATVIEDNVEALLGFDV